MPLISFKIESQKAIKLAECASVPRVMVIAGPNGVGKSTLLDLLRRRQGAVYSAAAKVIYQNPHRAIRRTQVRRRFVFGGGAQSFTDILASNDTPGFEGLQIQNTSRTPDNVDEAGSTLKYTLGRIENQRQTAQSASLDRARRDGTTVDPAQAPDVYQPLRDLTKYLLPHLQFKTIDFLNEDNIRAVWTRTDGAGEIELDLDDFSSGEKSIILLFLPLLEKEIYRRLRLTTTGLADAIEPQDLVFIVDEPEVHLHPDLQSKILTYMRNVAMNEGVQFILSTHSPTLLDQAYDDELFVLLPPNGTPPDNQLKKVATNLERLEALRHLTGNTFAITTGRSIVCVEGTADDQREPADVSLLQILYPRAAAYTFVPSGGKSQVITTTANLRDHLPEIQFGIKVFGLVDSDQAMSTPLPPGVVRLPVAMIENLLLNKNAILTYLQAHSIATFADNASVEIELRTIAGNQKENEIRLRVARGIKPRTIRLSGADALSVKQRHQDELQAVQRMLPTDRDLRGLVESATSRVDEIIAGAEELRYFAGKPILKEFYRKHVQVSNSSYKEFCYEVAQLIAKSSSLETTLNPVFDLLT
jgi:energy-coupling factor transporter ATP-binding protein EcfA2